MPPDPLLPEPMLAPLATLWKGTANAWECDEMGHLNVRHYAAKVEEAVDGMLADFGLPPCRASSAGPASAGGAGPIASHHIRYHRECRAGTPLTITGAPLSRGAAATVYCEFHAATEPHGAPRASFVTQLARDIVLPPGPCATLPPHGAPRGLPAHAAPRGQTFHAAPRGQPSHAAAPAENRRTIGLDEADQAGLIEITRTVIRPEDLDPAGALRAHRIVGMISDGVAHLMTRITPERGQHDAALGGAALEQRVFIHNSVQAGDPVTVRSGIRHAGEKTMHIVHWLLNRRTGQAFATSDVIAVTFDLAARRAVALPQAARDRIEAMRVTAEAG